MTEAQTYSWVFYATGLASQHDAASQSDIEKVADGINHAIPTQKEMRESIAWLVAHQFVSNQGRHLKLTQEGSSLLANAREANPTSFGVWKHIRNHLAQLGCDDTHELDPRTMCPGT